MAVIIHGKGPRAEQWAKAIREQVGKSVEAVLETGRLLIQAKGDLPHGEWGRMFTEGLVPFSQNAANRFMAVASNPVLSNCDHGHNLPPSWQTLYALSRLPEPTLTNALKDGLISPETERHEVRALIPRAPVDRRDPDPVFVRPQAPRNGMRFARMAVADLEQIEDVDLEREDAFAFVRAWLDAQV